MRPDFEGVGGWGRWSHVGKITLAGTTDGSRISKVLLRDRT